MNSTMTDAERRRLRLRLLMRQQKLFASEVAAIVGLQPQSVRLYMCGRRGTPEWIFKPLRDYLRSRPRLRSAA
jgi:hypothetical protein